MLSLSAPWTTPFHKIPVGLKLMCLSGLTIALFQAQSIFTQICFLAGACALYGICGRGFFLYGLKFLKPLWVFLVLLLFWHLLTASLHDGAVIGLRMINAVAFANFVTMTSKLKDMMAFFLWLLSPLAWLGIRTDRIALAFAMVIRFTPALLQRAHHIGDAWRTKSTRRPRWQIVVPMLLGTLDDADYVADALKARQP
ncbi:MAG: CbiQ family ECF transporter T component [Halocynthiibacter sp.]